MVKTRFRYVHYLKIKLELAGFLHIGGENNDEQLAVNGNGQFIMPASGIAGAIREYVVRKMPGHDLNRWFGLSSDAEKSMSKIVFYDSVCNDCKIEKRVGIRMDARYGVAEDGFLREKYYIGNGVKTDLKVQFFADDDEESNTVDKIIDVIISGFNACGIRMGANKTNGGGIFKAVQAEKVVFDLKKSEELNKYLDGVDKAFDDYTNKFEITGLTDDVSHSFSLHASIPNGLIVKSGEKEIIKDEENNRSCEKSLNMIKTITDPEGNEKEVFYIPGSTLKGVIRAYASRVCDYLSISQEIIGKIFGQAENKGDNIAGKVFVEDVIINDANERTYNRVKIDRWLGSAMDGALFSENVLSTTQKNKLKINVDILDERFSGDEENIRKAAYGLVFLALRDMGLGLVPLGSGNNVGYGRLKGNQLYVNGLSCKFDGSCLNCGENEELLNNYLDTLGGLGDENR